MSKIRPRAEQIGPESYRDRQSVLPPALAELADVDEPAFGCIIDGIVHAVLEEFDLDDPSVLKAIVDAARRRYERATNPRVYDRAAILDQAMRIKAERETKSVVYYMRIGDRVKIGTTIDLDRRVREIRPEEVMATEPGGVEVERQRHGQYGHFRTTGEWFRLHGSLREHIDTLREVASGGRAAG